MRCSEVTIYCISIILCTGAEHAYINSCSRNDGWWESSTTHKHTHTHTHRLTRAQSKSTASRMSSWCPMRETPSSSSSAWLILSSLSPHTPPRSNTHTYCCKQSSRPAANTHILWGLLTVNNLRVKNLSFFLSFFFGGCVYSALGRCFIINIYPHSKHLTSYSIYNVVKTYFQFSRHAEGQLSKKLSLWLLI